MLGLLTEFSACWLMIVTHHAFDEIWREGGMRDEEEHFGICDSDFSLSSSSMRSWHGSAATWAYSACFEDINQTMLRCLARLRERTRLLEAEYFY